MKPAAQTEEDVLSPRTRFRTAMILAVAADALQIFVFPLFAEGALSPADDVLDIALAAVLVHLLGWHWEFLPAFAAELVPGVDLVPFWTMAVANVYRKWKQITVAKEQRDEASGNRGGVQIFLDRSRLLTQIPGAQFPRNDSPGGNALPSTGVGGHQSEIIHGDLSLETSIAFIAIGVLGEPRVALGERLNRKLWKLNPSGYDRLTAPDFEVQTPNR
jgi:hypothetical protein